MGQRKLEINDDPSGEEHYIVKSADGAINIIPWCFAEDEIKVYVETSHLTQLKFEDNKEITQALKNAPRQYQEWILSKAD